MAQQDQPSASNANKASEENPPEHPLRRESEPGQPPNAPQMSFSDTVTTANLPKSLHPNNIPPRRPLELNTARLPVPPSHLATPFNPSRQSYSLAHSTVTSKPPGVSDRLPALPRSTAPHPPPTPTTNRPQSPRPRGKPRRRRRAGTRSKRQRPRSRRCGRSWRVSPLLLRVPVGARAPGPPFAVRGRRRLLAQLARKERALRARTSGRPLLMRRWEGGRAGLDGAVCDRLRSAWSSGGRVRMDAASESSCWSGAGL